VFSKTRFRQVASRDTPAPETTAKHTGAAMQSLESAMQTSDVLSPPAERGSAYAQLSRQIKQAGLLQRRSRYYFWKMAITAGLLVLGWVGFVLVGDSWWQLGVAAFLAIVFTQVGFLGHDAGHGQVFGSRRANYIVGVLHANLAIGLSYGWWVDKHNRHHAHPNHEEKDPDVSVAPLAFTMGQARRSRGLTRLSHRYQAWLFFPLLLLEGVSLHAASIKALVRRSARHRSHESLLLGLHLAGYFGLVFLVLSPVKAIVFIIVEQGLFGLYLGCSVAPNHKGMPSLDPADEGDFLRRQVLTSRNVRGNWLTDFALGGLNYQIEHHLFPSMPRPNLRHSRLLVRTFCRDNDVLYTETGLFDSYAQALRHLNTVSRATRTPAVA
jgi:fatty acid desaturase